jgi:hypothetical protein
MHSIKLWGPALGLVLGALGTIAIQVGAIGVIAATQLTEARHAPGFLFPSLRRRLLADAACAVPNPAILIR